VDFNFTDEEDAFRETVRRWVLDKYPKSKVNIMERQEDHDGSHFPHEFVRDLADVGFMGIGIDERYGGQGGGATIQAILMDEMARHLADLN